MATIKICDKCGTREGTIRGFRWMALMDKDNYKHTMIIKVDLCEYCHGDVFRGLSKLLKKTSV